MAAARETGRYLIPMTTRINPSTPRTISLAMRFCAAMFFTQSTRSKSRPPGRSPRRLCSIITDQRPSDCMLFSTPVNVPASTTGTPAPQGVYEQQARPIGHRPFSHDIGQDGRQHRRGALRSHQPGNQPQRQRRREALKPTFSRSPPKNIGRSSENAQHLQANHEADAGHQVVPPVGTAADPDADEQPQRCPSSMKVIASPTAKLKDSTNARLRDMSCEPPT